MVDCGGGGCIIQHGSESICCPSGFCYLIGISLGNRFWVESEGLVVD